MFRSRLICRWAMCAISVLCVLVFSAVVQAQSTTDGAVGGTVLDPSGAAVASAKITIPDYRTRGEQGAVTDETRYFRLGQLQAAVDTMAIDAAGLAPVQAARVGV